MTTKKDTKMKSNNAEVVNQGSQIVLPVVNGKPMTYDEGIEWLKRKKQEDEQDFQILHFLECSPLDGAVAFQKAIKAIYGWSHGVSQPGGFFSPDRPPTMVGVPTGPNEITNVPWGRLEIPGLSGYFETGMQDEPRPQFVIAGKVKKKHADRAKELVEKTKEILKQDSIYRGKAVRLSFEWLREDADGDRKRGFDPIQDSPKFLDLQNVKDDDLIFGENVLKAIDIGLFTPIEYSGACRTYQVPLKRGILLHGPYGTGKTMTAYVSALKAVRNGWTFIYLDDVRDLKKGLEFASQYAPAVIFAEDIDRAVNGGRTSSMDEVLNTLDGIDTKGLEILTVLTTNHLEEINPAMLRPGRLDTLVEVSPPDAGAAQRLVRLYSRGLLADDVDLDKVGNALAGKIPAFIREVTERGKIAAIARTKGGDITGKVLEVDLLDAAKSMEPHVALLKPRETKPADGPEMFVRVPANARETTQAVLERFKANSAA